ncbi:MAG: hemerythrin domain-containing protein [Bacteroidetes bacterium]|nr:MAG: hemerythrin domain-containing protein [Bacteroidota bacterium]
MSDKNPMAVLVYEHDIISAAANIISGLSKTWETDAAVYAEKVRRLLVFFREYSDQYHHYKEEEILFRELRENPAFVQTDIIDELEAHHRNFRENVAAIANALEIKDWPQAQEVLEGYMAELLDHIAIENDEFFLMAETVLSPEERARMYFRFEDIDRELGLDRKQALADAVGKA